jgi:putative FmdB family regulatory protein
MPMFDYSCGKCGSHFEELIMSNATPDKGIQCPDCKAFQSIRKLSAPAVSVGSSYRTSPTSPRCGAPAGSGFG